MRQMWVLRVRGRPRKLRVNPQVEIPRHGLLGCALEAHFGWDRLPKPVVSVEQEQRLPCIHEVLHVAGERLQDAESAAPSAAAASRYDFTGPPCFAWRVFGGHDVLPGRPGVTDHVARPSRVLQHHARRADFVLVDQEKQGDSGTKRGGIHPEI